MAATTAFRRFPHACALAALALACCAPAARAGFTNLVEIGSSDVGRTLAGETVYKASSSFALVASAGQSALKVADGATAVLYVPAGVTLTVRGGDASGTTGAGAGIEVPSTSTLVVVGPGSLVATGGNATDGTDGTGGGDPSIDHDNEKGYPGIGGFGGSGGGGAAAGIGGRGGDGGQGRVETGPHWHNCSGSDFDYNGDDGYDGYPGGAGGSAGSIYLLGSAQVAATGGAAGAKGGLAGSCGGFVVDHFGLFSYSYRASGGGGGGGGGSGKGASYGIGGGAGGGGAGGGGGEGGSYHTLQGQSDDTNYGGNGGGGKGASNGSGTRTDGEEDRSVEGGDGGDGGSAGSSGDDGRCYIGPNATFSGTGSAMPVDSHAAIEFTLAFSDPLGGTSNVVARFGVANPAAPVPQRPNCTFLGWFTEANGGGTKYYDEGGAPTQALFDRLGNLTLHAAWDIDDPSLYDVFVNGDGITGGVSASGPGWDYDGANGVLAITGSNRDFTISGTRTDGAIRLLVPAGVSASLKFDSLDLRNTSESEDAPVTILGTCSLALSGSSVISAEQQSAGIRVEEGASLSIGGDGALFVQGGHECAGIGGNKGKKSGEITISGGLLDVYGGSFAAGIGGGGDSTGQGGHGGTTRIAGGSMMVRGRGNGAAIGGGYGGNGGTIVITGGEVAANVEDGSAAAIGGGCGGSGGTIRIDGGRVVARGAGDSAAIGGGEGGSGGVIQIAGGTVMAEALDSSAAIGGGGSQGAAGQITISGGIVHASGGPYGEDSSAIGGGALASGTSSIQIVGGTVFVTSGGATKIGSGWQTSDATTDIRFTGGAIYAEDEDVAPNPLDGGGERVFPIDFATGSPMNAMARAKFGSATGYGANDLVADANGSLRVWLPSTGGQWYVAEIAPEGWPTLCIAYRIGSDGRVAFQESVLYVNDDEVVGGESRTGTGWRYDAASSNLVFTAASHFTVRGTSRLGEFRLVVPVPLPSLTLQDLSLASTGKYGSAIVVSNACPIVLEGTNAVSAAGPYAAGIEVAPGASLSISGEGALFAQGGRYGAGIGSRGGDRASGPISIAGGTVLAAGGYRGAGIGGGDGGSAASVSVSGGRVTATGGEGAPGIGGGYHAALPADGAFSFSGGTVVATGGTGSASDLVCGRGTSPVGTSRATVVSGGSVYGASHSVRPRPSDAAGAFLYLVTVTNLPPGAAVTNLSVSLVADGAATPLDYGTNDIFADAGGAIHLWLPSAAGIYEIVRPPDDRWTAVVADRDVVATYLSAARPASIVVGSIAVAEDAVTLVAVVEPASWLDAHADRLRVRAWAPLHPLPDPATTNGLLDPGSVAIAVTNDAATLVVPPPARGARFYRVEAP